MSGLVGMVYGEYTQERNGRESVVESKETRYSSPTSKANLFGKETSHRHSLNKRERGYKRVDRKRGQKSHRSSPTTDNSTSVRLSSIPGASRTGIH
ncbi:hypothetical protein RSAG8_06645, partial [Rhizoctonia solani AG-8 WAC10335]